MNRVILSPEYFPDPTIGRPVALGNIYVGIVDLDPEIEANRKEIFLQEESGNIVSIGVASQPIQTGAGGVPLYNGSPVTILTEGNYSLKVTDKLGAQVYYIPSLADVQDNVIGIDNLFDLLAVSGQADGDKYYIDGYLNDTIKGGGHIVWDSTADKATADGGTVFDPDTQGGFDGTATTRDAFLTAQGGGVGTGCFLRVWDNIFIEDFGAVGGVIDNDLPFNKSLIFANGKNIDIHAFDGPYVLGSQLSMGSDTTIRSAPGVIFKRNHNDNMLANDLGITGATTGYTGNGNIAIIGGVWDGNSVEFFDGFNTFEIGYADKVTFKDVTVLDVVFAHGIDLSASRNVLIDGCKFLGFADPSPPEREFSEAIQLDPNTDISFAFGGLDRTHNQNVTVRNCIFGDNPDQEDVRFTAWPVGVGGHAGVNDRFQTDIFINGNVFDGCLFAGVRVFKWDTTNIESNIFKTCERGVHVTPVSFDQISADDPDGSPSGQGQAGKNLIISGNEFIDINGDGVLFTPPSFDVDEVFKFESVIIANNNMNTNTLTQDACDLRWISKLVVDGNSYDSFNRGVHIQYCDSVAISNNTFSLITTEGIFAEEVVAAAGENKQALGFSSDFTISGNTLDEIGRTGINITNDALRVSITGNILTNVSTEVATRQGIELSDGVTDATVNGNSVFDNDAAIKPAKGIFITSSCVNVTVTGNHIDAAIPELIGNDATGLSYTAGLGISGTPENAVNAPIGSTVFNLDGGAGTTFFVKETAPTQNTGWVGK